VLASISRSTLKTAFPERKSGRRTAQANANAAQRVTYYFQSCRWRVLHCLDAGRSVDSLKRASGRVVAIDQWTKDGEDMAEDWDPMETMAIDSEATSAASLSETMANLSHLSEVLTEREL
jgi:hypothetical protein